MKPSEFIKKRSDDWDALDTMVRNKSKHSFRKESASDIFRFSSLYRSACTDLSLARTYRLPSQVQEKLGSLVADAHSHFYKPKSQSATKLKRYFLYTIPLHVYRDVYVRVCVSLFYFCFVISALFAYQSRDFAVVALGEPTLVQYEKMHSDEQVHEHGVPQALAGTGFYITNNTTLVLIAFGSGILLGIGSLYMVIANGIQLGAIIGALLQTPSASNILSWLPAHAPFELTAIGIAAGAGVRIGLSWIAPNGRERLRALREEALGSVPVLWAAVILTVTAAFIEAFLAPLTIPVIEKVIIGFFCLLLMFFYFIILGHSASKKEQTR